MDSDSGMWWPVCCQEARPEGVVAILVPLYAEPHSQNPSATLVGANRLHL